MKLNRVEIKGFKSLAKRTVLEFPGDVTCIAGPNGCGKSNVIDAIRWALGEQSARSLRAGNMSDVIFSGTQSVPAGNMSSVKLDFVRDNGYFPASLDGFDEVSISRKLFRSGESIYTINDVKCRLKDINEIFMDTGLDRLGYAIIEQGKVKTIIQSRPEDIRYLIEEAAEIGKFRVKRQEAIKRLDSTSRNFERIEDLLNEVSKQRNSLKTQARKAKVYQELRDRINFHTRILWTFELESIEEVKNDLEQQGKTLATKIKAIEIEIEDLSGGISDLSGRHNAISERIEDASRRLNEKRSFLNISRNEIASSNKRLKDISSTLEMIRARIENSQESEEEDRLRFEEAGKRLQELDRKISALTNRIEDSRTKVSAFQHDLTSVETEYDRTRAELFDSIGHARASDQRLSSMRKRLDEASSNTGKWQQDLESIELAREELKEELEKTRAEIEKRSQELSRIRTSSEELSSSRETLRRSIEQESQSLFALEKNHAETKTKIAMLDRIINPGEKKKDHDPTRNNGGQKVSDAISALPGHENTVGRFLGDILDYRIIENHEEILNGGFDRSAAGYIPLTPCIQKNMTDTPQGVIGSLCEYIKATDGFENLAEVLTKDTFVVGELKDAVDLWNGGSCTGRFVTLDGTIMEPSGIIKTSSGKDKYPEVLKARTEKEDLVRRLPEMEETIADTSKRLSDTKQRLSAMEDRLNSIGQTARTKEKELAAARERLGKTSSRIERNEGRYTSFKNDIRMWEEMAEKIRLEMKVIQEDRAEIDSQIAARQSAVKALDEKRIAAKKVLDEKTASMREMSDSLNALKVESASLSQKIKGIEEARGRRQIDTTRDQKRIIEIGETKKEISLLIEEAEEKSGLAENEISTLEKACESLRPRKQALEAKISGIKESIETKKASLEKNEKLESELMLRIKEQEVSMRMNLERLEARFGSDTAEIPEGFDPEAARQEIARLQTRIERMGQINFASIEAHEEVQSRWDDLHRQYEDLVQASTRLREVIASIERQSSKEFMATFTKVRAYFQEIFTTIFGGGKADIVLDGSNPLDAGIEIFACPPHKKPKAMSLLSEGEKTLCALSFIFALFKVRPAPFCIMDEVDAPLDDANVERFNRLIRTFSSDSQFLVVTHNRHTMAMADVIYGVTFDIPGISKVVSMNLEKINGK